ncbi:MAG: four-carbon acid sugar kinase family protein [Nocardioidaceae bacterium]
MTDLVIIADDLTGAADSAALLTRRGPTWVVVDPAGDWPQDAAVLAVDTNSRHTDPTTAAARVAAATERAAGRGGQVVKKIDSTMRGNIVDELRAMRDVLARDSDRMLMVVAPAFPATGRTTRGGVVHVAGQRLAAHGSDGDVVGMLHRGGIRALGVPGADASTLAARLEEAYADGFDAVVIDAASDDDVHAVVAAGRTTVVPTLLVGSGGLTRPLAEGASAPDAPLPSAAEGATLVVIGSYSEVSARQRGRLLEHGVTAVVLTDGHGTTPELRPAVRRGAVVLSPDPDAPVVRADAAQVARRLARAAVSVLDDIGSLVVTGGETARAVLAAAGVDRFRVTGEVEPGIVRGHVPELGIDLVTKAGSFGDVDALLRCLPPHDSPASQSRTRAPQRGSAP